MPYGGAHWTVLSKHSTGVEWRTNRGSGSSSDNDDDMN